jgi:SAM-dependent methyltransferase
LGWTPAARADIDYETVTARLRAAAHGCTDPAFLRAIEPVAEVVADRLDVQPEERVLDVDFGRADVHALPYADASFDAVGSVFAFTLHPRPRRVISELVRVCRPGGRVVLAAWVPRGLPGGLFELTERLSPLPAGVRSPADWGRADIARARLEPLLEGLEIRTRTAPLHFASPGELFAALAPAWLDSSQSAAARPGFDRLLASTNNRPPAAEVDARYLLLTGRRASEPEP